MGECRLDPWKDPGEKIIAIKTWRICFAICDVAKTGRSPHLKFPLKTKNLVYP